MNTRGCSWRECAYYIQTYQYSIYTPQKLKNNDLGFRILKKGKLNEKRVI